MSIQTYTYLEEMENMYHTILKKEKLTPTDVLFLEVYKRTLDSSIDISSLILEKTVSVRNS